MLGVQHRLLEGITSGYGFSGIVAALFGGLHPLGTIPASILFGALLVGGDKMQRATQVPNSLISTILGRVRVSRHLARRSLLGPLATPGAIVVLYHPMWWMRKKSRQGSGTR